MSTTPTTPAGPTKGEVVLENVLNDALLGLALAASIFVKNPVHQVSAANGISALSQLIKVIEAQINGTPAA